MNIYLAGRYVRREEINGYAEELRAAGHAVTSRWLNGTHEIEGQAEDFARRRESRQFAREDAEDVARSEIVISFTEQPRSGDSVSRGGRHVEFGMAWAWAKMLVVVGPVENVFHLLPSVAVYPDWATARANLPALIAQREALYHLLNEPLDERTEPAALLD